MNCRLFGAATCAILFAGEGLGYAQAEDQAAARALFDEGRKLASAGAYPAACPKFEAALKLYASAGALLNLGDCYEKIGRTASAWTTFGQALSLATRMGRADFANEAQLRQTEVETSLSRLVIHVPHAVPGLTIRRDGVDLLRAAWEDGIPVDPGLHIIQAEAPASESWSVSIDVPAGSRTTAVDVPALRPLSIAPAPPAAAALPGPAPSGPPDRRARDAGWILAGAGAAVAVAGGVLMVVEAQRASDSRTNHDLPMYNSTATPWTVGLVAAIAGGAGATTGLVLVAAFGHGASQNQAQGPVWLSVGAGGIRVGGSW
jgi:hypothetical protein